MTIICFPAHKIDREFAAETGLGLCRTCGGAEASMPEHCPQRRMTTEEQDAVQAGELDFRRSQGGWTTWTREKEMRIRRLVT
jgi:hypothetical protein